MPGFHVSVYVIVVGVPPREFFRYIVSTNRHNVQFLDVYEQEAIFKPFPAYHARRVGSLLEVYPAVVDIFGSAGPSSPTSRWGFGDYTHVLLQMFPRLFQLHFFENYDGAVDCYFRHHLDPAAHFRRNFCLGARSPGYWYCTEEFIFQEVVVFRDWDHMRPRF